MSKEVKDMTGPELVSAYNTLAAKLPNVNQVKKFGDRKTGIKRYTELLARAEAAKPKGKTRLDATDAKTKKTKDGKPSRRAVAHQMVRDGKTNDEIFVALKKIGLTEEHRSHVAWYRAEAYRLGFATKPAKVAKPPKTKRKAQDDAPEAAVDF